MQGCRWRSLQWCTICLSCCHYRHVYLLILVWVRVRIRDRGPSPCLGTTVRGVFCAIADRLVHSIWTVNIHKAAKQHTRNAISGGQRCLKFYADFPMSKSKNLNFVCVLTWVFLVNSATESLLDERDAYALRACMALEVSGLAACVCVCVWCVTVFGCAHPPAPPATHIVAVSPDVIEVRCNASADSWTLRCQPAPSHQWTGTTGNCTASQFTLSSSPRLSAATT